MSIRAVLLATDFSSASDGARRMADEIARQASARLHVVHVVPPVTAPGDAAALLAELGRSLDPEGRVQSALLHGRPAREIVRYAVDNGVDLIVVGTHGRTGVTRAIIGSVAEAVVRLSRCPVLTVPAAAPAALAEAPPVDVAVGHRCAVCGQETEDLICETCRNRIRAEALDRKMEAERTGRRGMPA